MARRSGLGRGLGALIPSELAASDQDASLRELAVSQIDPNPLQPRERFDEESLVALTASISELGVLQPVLVRPVNALFKARILPSDCGRQHNVSCSLSDERRTILRWSIKKT